MSKDAVLVHGFYIRSSYYPTPELTAPEDMRGSRGATAIVNGPSNVSIAGGHTITIENLTTLPYNVEVASSIPDLSASGRFLVQGSLVDRWTASFKSLTSTKQGKTCSVVHEENRTPAVRVQTSSLKFRLPFELTDKEIAIDPILEIYESEQIG